MEQREPTEEELRVVEEGRKFVEELSKEMDGKQIKEVLPLDISAVAYACFARLCEDSPLAAMMQDELMNLVTLTANSVLKFQEHKIEEAQALERLWKED